MRNPVKSVVAAIALSAISLSAAEVINLTGKDMWKEYIGKGKVAYTEGQFTTDGYVMLGCSKLIEIDPAKTYTLKMTLVGNNAKRTTNYIGFDCVNPQGRGGAAYAWQGKNASFTQVTRDAKKGDKVIYVKDGKNWNSSTIAHVIINAKEDGSDIPNSATVASGIASVKQEGEEWAINLKNPLKKDVAANTNVREHFAGGYMYVSTQSLPVNGTHTVNAVIKGSAAVPSNYSSKVWPFNAKKARLLLMLDYSKTGAKITVKDATLTIE